MWQLEIVGLVIASRADPCFVLFQIMYTFMMCTIDGVLRFEEIQCLNHLNLIRFNV